MEINWAAEHLQTIRTLMERSALYRRALAPIFTLVGVLGILAAIAGWKLNIVNDSAFEIYWMSVCVAAIAGALLLVRRQALKSAETFWSPPTRRVAQAVAPMFLIGLILGCESAKRCWGITNDMYKGGSSESVILIVTWTLLYGLALHAAGFFMPRGIRLFAWGFLIIGLVFATLGTYLDSYLEISPHWIMGLIFGVSHLAYGMYLYFTEQRKNEA